MIQLADTFALCTKPRNLWVIHVANASQNLYFESSGKTFSVVRETEPTRTFNREAEVWRHMASVNPDLVADLLSSRSLEYRASGWRAQIFLSRSEPEVLAMLAAIEAEMRLIHEHALAALSAVPVEAKAPRIQRESKVKPLTWHRIHHWVQAPVRSDPVPLTVRMLPNPLEARTWSVQLDIPLIFDDDVMLWLHQGHAALVQSLATKGIQVKDACTSLRYVL